jgi:hypothetical protein
MWDLQGKAGHGGAEGSQGKPTLTSFLMSLLSIKLSAPTVDHFFFTNLTHCRPICCVVEWVVSDVSKECGAFEASGAAHPLTSSYLTRSSLAALLCEPQIYVMGRLKTQQRWEFFSLWMFIGIRWQTNIGSVLIWTRNITSTLVTGNVPSKYQSIYLPTDGQ